MNRFTHLDMAVFDIDSNDYLGLFDSVGLDLGVMTQEGAGVSQRHDIAIPVKKGLEFDMDEFLTASNLRQCNLDITVFSVGGTNYLGDLRSGTLNIKTGVSEGSGAKDAFKFPVARTTSYEGGAELIIPKTGGTNSNLLMIAELNNAGVATVPVALHISLGGIAFQLPVTITKIGQKVTREDVQVVPISFSANGAPTSISGHTLVENILTGVAAVTWSADTGTGTYSGNAIIDSTNITFNDAQLIKMAHHFLVQGQPTAA